MRRTESFEIRASGFAVLIAHDACAHCGETAPVTSLLVTAFETELAGYSMAITGAALMMDIHSLNPGARHEWARRAPWLGHKPRSMGLSPLIANVCVHCGHATVESDRRLGPLNVHGEGHDRILYSWVDAPLRACARFDSAPWMDRLAERHSCRSPNRPPVKQGPHRAAA